MLLWFCDSVQQHQEAVDRQPGTRTRRSCPTSRETPVPNLASRYEPSFEQTFKLRRCRQENAIAKGQPCSCFVLLSADWPSDFVAERLE